MRELKAHKISDGKFSQTWARKIEFGAWARRVWVRTREASVGSRTLGALAERALSIELKAFKKSVGGQ